MTKDLQAICWPAARLGEALEALARNTALPAKSVEVLRPPAWLLDGGEEKLNEWIELAAGSLGLEAKPIETPFAEARSLVQGCGPALLRLEFPEEEAAFLVIMRGGRRSVLVLTPERKHWRASVDAIRAGFCRPLEASALSEIDRLLNAAGIRGRWRESVAAGLLQERLGTVSVHGCWLIRVPSSGVLLQQMRENRVLLHLAGYVAAHTIDVLLFIGAWWMIGRAVLDGRLDYGWFLAWALVLVTRIPFQVAATWLQGVVALHVGAILKRRLLAGGLRLQPEEIRHQGVGQLLGRVIESEALESLALGGGMTGLVAIVEVILAMAVLAMGAQNILLAFLLPIWTTVTLFMSWRYLGKRQRWTDERLDMTHDLIERLVGHRTRLAQEDPKRWHDAEDESIERYVDTCTKMDRSLATLVAVVPRGWLVLSLVFLVQQFHSGSVTPTGLAVTFGGMLLALGALKKLTASAAYLGGAVIAWRKVKPLFDAAVRAESEGIPEFALSAPEESAPAAGQILLEARDLGFAHQGRAEKVLDTCSLHIAQGDRILLEGPSGGGKSTLASLLAGLRKPRSGLIMLRGLDWQTLGAKVWRRRVAAAPQFHENYVLAGTLAFNLLMGRQWPPQPKDLAKAEEVCRELGLGNLIDRMPAGLFQQVGETGWQLSHGERSRVFLARALLQGADVVILDESFGALDPETLYRAMDCVRARARALMVIAHP